jgi:hypothetical protein
MRYEKKKNSKTSYLERRDWHMGYVSIKLFLRTFLIITFPYNEQYISTTPKIIIIIRTLEPHPQPVRNGLDTLRPDGLVEFRIESDVARAHRLAREFDDGLDSPGSTLFERAAVHTLVEVDGVFPGDDVLEGRARLARLVNNNNKCGGEL